MKIRVHPFPASAAVIAALLVISLLGCENRNVTTQTAKPASSLNDVTPSQWQRLGQTTIYFGHQSVGANILDGIRDLQREHPEIQLKIVASNGAAVAPGAAFVEFAVGENGDPASKDRAFRTTLQSAAAAPAVAMYKYCYLDTSGSTDAEKMFAAYRENVNAVRSRHPGVTIVHFTSPLTTVEAGPKALLKQVLGKPTARQANARRNRFNELLRAEYASREPIFDLAAIESTRPDGSQSFFEANGQKVFTLAPEYTDDGGHLNQRGRRIAAERLLITLATLP